MLQHALECFANIGLNGMPLVNTHILGVTSLWIGIPVFYGALQASPFHILMACTLTAACVVSVVFWSDPKEGAIVCKAREVLSWVFAIELVWFSACSGLDPANLFLMVACVVFHYGMSDFFIQKRLWRLQLIAHLMFRFALYWWVHLLMVPPSRREGLAFIILTLGYFTHAFALYRGVFWESTLMRREQYWLSCAASVCWVWLNARAHWELNKELF
jgi:hypothetical protein